jgi:non-specific serine/threonine protein kinase
LAIQLAAAQAKLFAPTALLARLRDRFALLTGGTRDQPTRQQTLRSAIDWSYHQLTPASSACFGARRCSWAAGRWGRTRRCAIWLVTWGWMCSTARDCSEM